MDSVSAAEVLDAGLIAAAQKMEHYEIATYGCARTYADLLDQGGDVLQQTLDEEKETDQKLTELAVSQINLEAAEDGLEVADRKPMTRKHSTARSSKK